VLTCDGDNRAGRMSIYVRDGRIADLSPNAAGLTSQYPQADVIDVSARIIAPGFVNAHFHAESPLLRSFTRGHALSSWGTLPSLRQATEFLLDVENEAAFEPIAMFAGIDHLLHGTTTAAASLPGFDEHALKAAVRGYARSGIRTSYVIRGWNQIRVARQALPGQPPCAVAFDTDEDITVYSVEKHLHAAKELGFAPAFELAETRKSADAFKRNFKKNQLRVLTEAGALPPSARVAHGNYFADSDLDLLRKSGGTLTLCAGSAARKKTGCPLLLLLASSDVRVAIGTDWGSVDMLEEVRFLASLPQVAPGVRQFRPLELLRMATINGAHALGLGDEIGSLEAGKRADLIMFSLDNMLHPFAAETTGSDVLAEAIIDRMNSGRLADVMINGEFRIRNHVPAGIDLQPIDLDLRTLIQRASPQGIPHAPSVFLAKTGSPVIASSDQTFTREKKGVDQPEAAHPMAANLSIITSSTEGAKKQHLPELKKNVKRVFGEDDE
jgi:5-methylthioadenosine/S-adenosylhomocysteine deaminase